MESKLLLNGIDEKTVTVDLSGEVDLAMYRRVLFAVHEFEESGPITFVLNTEGGSFYQGLAIYDLIKNCAPDSKIVCVGEVMSAGTIILMASDNRVSYPNTQFLLHYGQEINESSSEAHHNARMTKEVKDLLENKTEVTRRTINNWFKKETFYKATDAVRVGLIHRIVGADDE